MHIWKVDEGEVTVAVGPLRPHVFGARLYFRDDNGVEDLRGAVADGIYTFAVSSEKAESIRNGDAYLFVTTRHVLHPGSADLRWGWRYRCQSGAGNSDVTDGSGISLDLDTDSFLRSNLERFDEPVEIGRETIVFRGGRHA